MKCFVFIPPSQEVLQKDAAGTSEAFQGVFEEGDGGPQFLGLLLLLLDLGLQGVAEGLGPGAVGGESGLVLLLPGFSHLGSQLFLYEALQGALEEGDGGLQFLGLLLLLLDLGLQGAPLQYAVCSSHASLAERASCQGG